MDEIVYRELYACIKITSSNLWFLALIIKLYHNADVTFSGKEEWLKLSAPITLTIIQSMSGPSTSASKPLAGPSSSPLSPSFALANATNSKDLTQQVTDLQQQLATLLL